MERIEVFRDGVRLVELVARKRVPEWAEFVVEPDGWNGWPAPAVKRENVEREAGHGSYHTPTYLGDTAVMVSGHALAGSPRELAQMRRELMRCYPGEVVLQVTDESGVLRAEASLTQAPVFRTLQSAGERNTARFEIEFWLPDPWKYGRSETYPLTGSTSVWNRGEQDAWPVIRVNGPASNVTIQANGRTKRINRSIASGQWVELDCRRDIARLSTGARLGTESSGLAPFLRPGENTVTISGAAGSITVTETFI